MNKKLTLLLDEKIIEQAKDYASKHNESLSAIVAKYFAFLTGNWPSRYAGRFVEKEIEDIIGIVKLPANIDIEKEYREYRAKKSDV